MPIVCFCFFAVFLSNLFHWKFSQQNCCIRFASSISFLLSKDNSYEAVGIQPILFSYCFKTSSLIKLVCTICVAKQIAFLTGFSYWKCIKQAALPSSGKRKLSINTRPTRQQPDILQRIVSCYIITHILELSSAHRSAPPDDEERKNIEKGGNLCGQVLEIEKRIKHRIKYNWDVL